MPRTLAHDAAAGQNPPIQDRILAQILKPLHEFPENKPQISSLPPPDFLSRLVALISIMRFLMVVKNGSRSANKEEKTIEVK
jgi:hypothetical protein